MSIFSIFKRGLEKSATKISRVVKSVFSGVKIHGKESFDDLEAMLVAADFGVPAAMQITNELRDLYERGAISTDADLVKCARDMVAEILKNGQREINRPENGGPVVILMVGVNGSGKTTTIGKMAANLKKQGKKVILAACENEKNPVHLPRQYLPLA